jgi:hypothetical protein
MEDSVIQKTIAGDSAATYGFSILDLFTSYEFKTINILDIQQVKKILRTYITIQLTKFNLTL